MERLINILWDEHFEPVVECPILLEKDCRIEWYYIFDNEFNTYLLYHNPK